MQTAVCCLYVDPPTITFITGPGNEDVCSAFTQTQSHVLIVFLFQDCHSRIEDMFTNKIYQIGITALGVAVVMVSTNVRISAAVCTAAAGLCPHSCSTRR